MKDFFKEMFNYTFQFNNEVLAQMKLQEEIPEKSFSLLNHTFNAHEIWNARIFQEKSIVGVWEVRPFETLASINATNYKKTLDILETCDFKSIVSYKTSNGKAFKNSIQDILFHIVNHSTYHRAQIATNFKQHDIVPIISDYIFYKRG
jgi:uncharacterized damage-inducible protein DinB